jgi:23S rRNA pseudouridine2457 synthase
MTAAIGYPTLRLIRVSIEFKTGKTLEKLSLEDLKPGEWREVTQIERYSLERLN